MIEKETTKFTEDINKLTLKNVLKLVDKTLKVYDVDASRIIADYRSEKQYTADYDGRQILELLQNADDAQTDVIDIEINTDLKTVTLSNNGIPFSLDGVKSLMLANMSPKNKKEFIGNKGLGFRSILNWVNQVEVITQNVVLKFSEDFSKKNYNRILEKNIDFVNLIKNDETLVKGEVPFAVLAIPDIEEVIENVEWTTSIKLHYKASEEKSILKQLNSIQEETLLFLKHTEKINIINNNEDTRVYNKSRPDNNKIQVNNKIWNIYNSGECKYDESKMYSYQIAWQDNLEDKDGVFYTYFPTNFKTHLPCLIHATFDLNASRKDINPTLENKYVLSKIAEKLGELAVTELTASPSNWKAYKFLNKTKNSDNEVLKGFYEIVDHIKHNLAIYPSLDNKYYPNEDVYNYENNFLTWVFENNFGDYFPKLVRPINDNDQVDNLYLYNKYYSPEELLVIINSVNTVLTDLKERVKLIRFLLSDSFKNLHESKVRLPLLIDRRTNLPTNKQLFTIRQEEDESYLDIVKNVEGFSFILPEIFDLLESELVEEIKLVEKEKEDVSRSIKRIIDKIVNIGSNDIIDVIRYMVNETRKRINNEIDENEVIIKNFINALHLIFIKNSDRKGNLPFSIPILNRNRKLVNSDDVFFGDEYFGGQLTEYIFKGIYDNNDYLLGNDYWELKFDNQQEMLSFFTWLGVNKYIKLQKDVIEVTPPIEYQELVFKSRPDLQKTYHYYKGIRIVKESILEKLTIEKLLVLISKEDVLKKKLSENHEDVYKYKYGSGYPKELYGFSSLIEYQIKKTLDFTEYIVENEVGVGQLFKMVNYQDEIFINYNVSLNEVKGLLERLGAVRSLDDISINQFYALFENQEEMFPKGRGSGSFYKRFLEYCTKNKEISKSDNNFDFSEFNCFARMGGKKESDIQLLPVSEIYYSDNNLVPQDILDKYPILFLSKRLGEQNVKKYFGVNLIQDVIKNIHIDKNDIQVSIINNQFNEHINKLKPYFLYYRLDVINDDSTKNDAINLTKNLDIKLVNKCLYHFDDGKKFNLEENFFIKIGSTFYIKNDSSKSIDSLIHNLVFCDTVAEVLNTQYKVKEHHDRFRAIFKDSTRETEYVIISKEGKKLLKEAKELLGVSKIELDFWTKIYDFKGLVINNIIKDSKELSEVILKDFEFDMSSNSLEVDYQNLDTEKSSAFLREINSQLGVPINQLFDADSRGLANYHLLNFETTVLDYKKFFNSCLWGELNKDNSKQKSLITSQEKYENFIRSQQINDMLFEYRFDLDVNYIEILKDEVYKVFGFKLKEEEINEIAIQTDYLKLLKENKIAEVEIEDSEIRSLLYFNGNLEKLNTFMESDMKEENSELEDNVLEKVIGTLIFSSSRKVIPKPFKNSGGRRGTWNHSDKDIKRNKRAGKKAEELTYYTLLDSDEVAEVEWVSSFSNTSDKSDNKHYDIRYKPVDSNSWKYLEVKSFNGTYFHLSRSEKEEAFKRGKYFEIALVTGEEVHIQRGLFTDNIDFENNNLFYATPSDYIITLDIEDNLL